MLRVQSSQNRNGRLSSVWVPIQLVQVWIRYTIEVAHDNVSVNIGQEALQIRKQNSSLAVGRRRIDIYKVGRFILYVQ